MSKAKTNMIIKRIVDAAMTALLLLLMAYQVTGEMAHEWIGMGMTALVIAHQILNRKWYSGLFKGKYNPYRSITTVLNILLMASFILTAFCGMSMSGYAVPFLYGMAPVSFVRRMHLSMSHWAFVLMGLHLGMHIPAMTAGLKLTDRTKTILACIFTCIGGIGLWLFLKNGMPNYLFFRVPFAFLDYDKAGWLVFIENLLMLTFWAFIGTRTALICRNAARKAEAKKNPLLPVVAIMASVIMGIALMLIFPAADEQASFGNTDWSAQQTEAVHKDESSQQANNSAVSAETLTAPVSESTQETEVNEAADPAAEDNSPVVYFTSDISAEGLVRIYDTLGWAPEGKAAVKISTGEPPASNYLRPELIGILASTDPVALDQACVDLIYQAEGNESLVNRIESLHGIHTLEHAEEIGLGSRAYELVNIDD